MGDNETMQGENLQPEGENATISADVNTAGIAQGTRPEDTHDARDSIMEQQASTIDLLMEQNARLQGQIEKLLRSGAQISDGKQSEKETPRNPFGGFGMNSSMVADEVQSFRDLGKEIGKK